MDTRVSATRRAALLLGVVVCVSSALPGIGHAECDNPRQALLVFEQNLRPERSFPQIAARCFDFTGFRGSREDQIQVVVDLKKVLDARGLSVAPDDVPAEPGFKDALGESRYVLFPADVPEIYLERVGGEWKFSQTTVSKTSLLYNETFAIGLQHLATRLPDSLQAKVFGVTYWQLIAVILLLVLAFPLGLIVEAIFRTVVKRLTRADRLAWAHDAVGRTRWPFVILVAASIALPGIREIGLSVGLTRALSFGVKLVALIGVVVVTFRLVDVFTGYLAGKAASTDTKLDDQLVPLIRKATKVTLSLIAGLFILQNLDVDVGSLLAGLGLGGLAFALAAKDTLANLFGSFTIFLDRPFQIGDWVIVGGVEGTVEEVGFRSTRVRTFYKSVVTVPNSKIADSVVDNMGIRSFRRLKLMLGLTYDTPPDKIQAFVEGVRAILHANDAIWQDYFEVHFNKMSASSLDVMVYAFLDVNTWTEELDNRHKLLLEFLRLADKLGVSFAFPTQSLHIESQHAEMPPATHATRDELEKIIHGFGPKGEYSAAEGRELVLGGYFPKTSGARGSDDGE